MPPNPVAVPNPTASQRPPLPGRGRIHVTRICGWPAVSGDTTAPTATFSGTVVLVVLGGPSGVVVLDEVVLLASEEVVLLVVV